MADEIFVINVGGYIGEITKSEIEYAKMKKKLVNYYWKGGGHVMKNRLVDVGQNSIMNSYVKSDDIIQFFDGLSVIFQSSNTLEEVFLEKCSCDDINLKNGLICFVDRVLPFNNLCPNYLLPSPNKKSACKRLNLFLKWMIRKGPVDLGLWENFSSSQLLMPIDVHVARMSRGLGLFEGKSNNWQTAEIITEELRKFDEKDPVKYDFALFGYGIENSKKL